LCCTLKKIISQKRHNIFLIDYQLGKENGIELLKYAVKIGCKVPIIMLTAQGSRDVDIEAMKAGAADYIDKTQLSSPLLGRVIRYAILRNYGELELKKSQQEIKKSNITLQETFKELEKANKKILSQQKAVIEEEFAVIFPNTNAENAKNFYNRLRSLLSNHIFKYKGFKFSITISAGIASYNCELNKSQIQLISDADDALYMAKNNGRYRVIISNL